MFSVIKEITQNCARIDMRKVKGTITELLALSEGIKFSIKQIESLLLYKTVFLPRLVYDCEPWSGLTTKDLKTLRS